MSTAAWWGRRLSPDQPLVAGSTWMRPQLTTMPPGLSPGSARQQRTKRTQSSMSLTCESDNRKQQGPILDVSPGNTGVCRPTYDEKITT